MKIESIGQILDIYGIDYKTEYRFHATRKWRFDYAIPDYLIAIEYEGGVFSDGRHTRGTGFVNDCDKYNAAILDGWRLLRYTIVHLNKKPEQIARDVQYLMLDSKYE